MIVKSGGHLDPGTPRGRKSISGCKCLLYFIVTLILAFLAIGLVYFATNIWNGLLTPHKHLYHNVTLAQVADRTAVVQPLVDREQTFDLTVTVWLTTSKERNQVDSDMESTETEDVKLGGKDSQPLVEEALFSDVIFHGVRLRDKDLHTTVNFTVPTDVFRNINLTDYDLRASVMLIPTAPSLLDFITSYSSHIPDSVSVLPVRSWPFPLGYRNHQDKTLADRALESFGVSVPLIQFHRVPSRCASVTPGGDVVDEAEEEYSEQSEELTPTSLEGTDGRTVMKRHPYIVTRTQIRVLDEINLFERKPYNKAQKRLKKLPCKPVLPGWHSCKRQYLLNGNWETQLELEIPDATTGEMRTEWAYAPFVSLSKHGFGSKDLLPIPVDRENCTGRSLEEPGTPMIEKNSVEVAWKVSYSGFPPSKMNAAEMVDEFKRPYTFKDTTNVNSQALDVTELANGLMGHRFSEDVHPRRQLFIAMILSPMLYFTLFCLRIRYWFTRRSTASISILGTTLMAVSSILGVVNTFLDPAHFKSGTLALVATVLYTSVASLMLPLIQLKTVLHIEFDWSKSWIPRLFRVNETHSERASARLEAQTGWLVQAVLFFSVLAIYHFLVPHNYIIIPAANPDYQPAKSNHGVPIFLLLAMDVVGTILQNIFNWRSRTYAGGYRITAAVKLALYAVHFMAFVPALVGRVDTRGPMHADTLVLLVLSLVGAWQALTMPSVKQRLEEDHVE